MKIHILSDAIANRIAAGEVVDRPVSVVRELVENSIDAGASDVSVFLDQGGRRLIRVVDDGSGMGRDDAVLAWQRHATSKIKTLSDVSAIATLGFRGEALPSIASVSRIVLKTKEKGAEFGTVVRIEGGRIISVQGEATPEGTDVAVSHLFFNTPARRKFLTAAKTETSRVLQFMQQLSLCYPAIRFRLIADGEALLNLPKSTNRESRSRGLYRGNFFSFEKEVNQVSVTGLLGHPSTAEVSRAGLTLIVNGRVVSDRLLFRAVKDGFDSMLKDKEQPVGYVAISLSPHRVDVNVHPQKLEVKFSEPGEIFSLVREAVKAGLSTMQSPRRIEEYSIAQPILQLAANVARPEYHENLRSESSSSSEAMPSFFTPLSLKTDSGGEARQASSVDSAIPYDDLQYLGQFAACYLLFSSGPSLFILDMHAAHERCQFNRIRNALLSGGLQAQQLLIPEPLALSHIEEERLLTAKDEIASLGYSFVKDQTGRILITAVPALLAHLSARSVVGDLLQSDCQEMIANGVKEKLDAVAARLACHRSVRSGQVLQKPEVDALLNDLQDSTLSTACPHGRPVWVCIPESRVESWFGR